MAFVLGVNLRIQEVLGLDKVQASLSKLQTTVQTGAAAATGGGGSSGLAANAKAQATAMTAAAAATNTLNNATSKLSSSQQQAANATKNTANATEAGGKSARNFADAVRLATSRYAAFVAGTAVPLAAIAGLRSATAAVVEFDSAILRLRQITGESAGEIGQLRDNILGLSTATGTSATDLADVGKVLAQAGFRGEQLTESLGALAKVPLTPSFESIDTAIEGTIAALNQFNQEGLTTTEILDVATALSNNFAASAEDIFKGLSRGGAAFEAIGGSFQELAAVFTTVRQATRESAETVGTFIKTISSRLADPKIVDFLEGKGIRIAEAIEDGNPVEAIKRIAQGLSEIGSVQDRIEIGTKLGGRRQISRLLALVSNIDTLDEALQTAANSAGSFDDVAEVGLQGLQAQLNILGQEFNRLVQELAEPLFIPIIKSATAAGKVLADIVGFAKPIIPVLTAIVGFSAAFKILATAITSAGQALAFVNSVGRTVGGGLAAATSAVGAGLSGGAAGTTARDRIQRRLAGGVGVGAGQAAAAGAGASLAGRARSAAASPVAQLAITAGIALAADKFSEAAQEAGNSAGVFAAETTEAAAIVALAISVLSGKSITEVATALGPIAGAATAAVVAIGAMTFAAEKAAEIDVQRVVDEVAKKVSEFSVGTIEPGDQAGLQSAVGAIGTAAIEGVQEAAEQYEDDWFDFFANASRRVQNLFTGQGNLTISEGQAQEIINKIVGSNPEALNEILKAAVDQFGAINIEAGLDQLLAETFGGNIEAATRVRQAIITQLGGLEKISTSIDKIQVDAKVERLANSIEKAAREFDTLRVPVQLTDQLGFLSDAVGRAASAIETNVSTFDTFSQLVGQDIGVPELPSQFSTEAVENIARQGNLSDFIDISQFEDLEGFTQDIATIGNALDEFTRSIIRSKANSETLAAQLQDPQVDPFDILSQYIDKFIAETPTELPPEAEAAFRAAAENLGRQISGLLETEGGVLPDAEVIQEAFDQVLSNQRPFYDAGIEVFQQWLNAQAQQLNLQLQGEQLLARADINTSQLEGTILTSLQTALSNVGLDLDIPDFDSGFGDVNQTLINVAQNGDLLNTVLSQFEQSFQRNAELNRQVAEAQQDGTGASQGLLQAARDSAVEVLNLQVALTQLSRIAEQAPEAFRQQQADLDRLGVSGGNPKTVEDFARRLEEASEATVEYISRQRQFIEAQTAIDVSQAFREPADIFAEALRESASAVRAFTSALTTSDLERGFGAPGLRTTPEGRAFVERAAVPEARPQEQQQQINTQLLESALFGGNVERVLETALRSAAEVARTQAREGRGLDSGTFNALANSLDNFQGFIFDIPKVIQESGLDPGEVARITAETLRNEAQQPGARESENIGGLRRTIGDLTGSIQTLIERPEVATDPGQLTPQLTPALQEFLQRLSSPQDTQAPQTEDTTRQFEDLRTSASTIQQAASDQRLASDATTRSTEGMQLAVNDIRLGATDILTGGQALSDAITNLQAVVDVNRDVFGAGQQEIAGAGSGGDGAREAIGQTTEAVNALGERVDAVASAIDIQTQQAAELAASRQENEINIPGLDENTSALAASNEVAGATQSSMNGLGEELGNMASAIQQGIGINVETASNVEVDVQGVSAAAREFTAEFEAVAQRVAKEEIKIILQQLARNAGNPEAASTFENVVT